MIPYRLFYQLSAAIDNIAAAEQLHEALAVAHGQAMVTAGKNARVKSQTRSLIRLANPEVL